MTASRASVAAKTESSTAASDTVRVIGPAVSCECAIGTMPSRLTRPSVGLTPTRPLTDDGEMIDPSVSVPTATVAKLAAIAAADPELEPLVLRSSAYGFFVSPPRELQPEVERVERKLAHSDRLVLPRITAPASRRRLTMKASRGGFASSSAMEPAVVCMRSAVAMLSLSSTGMPCSGPRSLPARRSRSRSRAMPAASGLSSITELTRGPARSKASMRARYRRTSPRLVASPARIAACSSSTPASTMPAGVDGAGAAMAWSPISKAAVD